MDAAIGTRQPGGFHGILIGIALIFHIVGLVGIGIIEAPAIQRSTPAHLILMGALLLLSFRAQLRRFVVWALITAIAAFWAEWLGVHTGLLFGKYRYGTVLGPRALDIPLLIGLNWVAVVAGACSLAARIPGAIALKILAAALLATGYDWIMEPVAIRLGYWHWLSADIPAFNYLCWAGLSAAFAALWHICRLRGNIFAAGLFVIQLAFFILLRILL